MGGKYGEGKDTYCYIRGGKGDIRLHPGSKKGSTATSGEGKEKYGYIRGGKGNLSVYIRGGEGGKIQYHQPIEN